MAWHTSLVLSNKHCDMRVRQLSQLSLKLLLIDALAVSVVHMSKSFIEVISQTKTSHTVRSNNVTCTIFRSSLQLSAKQCLLRRYIFEEHSLWVQQLTIASLVPECCPSMLLYSMLFICQKFSLKYYHTPKFLSSPSHTVRYKHTSYAHRLYCLRQTSEGILSLSKKKLEKMLAQDKHLIASVQVLISN